MNNKQDILNELKLLSPTLFTLKENEKSIAIPENYFEELADVVLFQTNNEQSILSKLKNENAEVPTTYFETFSDSLMNKIKNSEENKTNGKVISLPKQKNKIVQIFSRISIAASIIGAIFLVKEIQEPLPPTTNYKAAINSLSTDEIFQYMHNNSTEFSTQQIRETVKPILANAEINYNLDEKTITQYIEENKNIYDVDDATTDIF